MTTLAPNSTATSAFPLAAVETCLRNELIESVKADASIKGISLPTSAPQILRAPVQIDSLVVVSILCAVEPIIGFELPDSVVDAGGYLSVEKALGQLIPRIEAEWVKKKGARS